MTANLSGFRPLRPLVLCLAVLASGCHQGPFGSPPATATPVVVAPAPPPPPANVPAMDNISPDLVPVVRLARAGVGEDVMVAFIVRSPVEYYPTAEEIVLLKDLGVTDKALALLLKPPGARLVAEIQPAPVATNAVPAQSAPAIPAAPAVPPVVVTNPPPVETAPAPVAPATTVIQQTVVVPVETETLIELPVPDTQVVRHFWPSLEPYGTWVQLTGYGWCWRPAVVVSNPHWRPYVDNGRWIYSDHGWYWLSDYSWGWAPFHYGRWFRHSSQGWCWVPGNTWSPAWVSWRQSPDYCGWAPLPPVGRGFHFSVRTHDFGLHATYYTYVPTHRLCDPTPVAFCAPATQINFIHGRSTVINHFHARGDIIINNGLPAADYARAAGRPANAVNVLPLADNHARPDQLHRRGDSLAVYRPQTSQLPLIPSAAEVERGRSEIRKPEATATRPTTGGASTRGSLPSAGNTTQPAPLPVAGAGRTAGNSGNGSGPVVRPSVGRTLPTAVAPVNEPTPTALQSVQPSQSGVPIHTPAAVVTTPSRREPNKPVVSGAGRSNSRAARSASDPDNSPALLPSPYTPAGTTRPFTPPQPITSVPQPLGVDARPLTPPQPITSVPQPLGVDARPFTPPQAVTVPPADSPGQPRTVREPGRYEPSRSQVQEMPRWEQNARGIVQPSQQSSPWERSAARQLQAQPAPQPARPSVSPPPSQPSFTPAPPQRPSAPPAPVAAPAPAPSRPSAPVSQPSSSPSRRGQSDDSGSPGRRSEPRR
jgi:hypothetical protein